MEALKAKLSEEIIIKPSSPTPNGRNVEASMKILSKEIIKPSSPTPNHHRKIKLSYLDQMAGPMYIPIIFFYQANESSGLTCSNHSQISQHLKRSLSDTLTSFYPLAGTVEDDSQVECNDSGVEFIEARVHAQLTNAIQDENIDGLKQYLPFDPICGKGTPLVVKTTFFNCGGMSIGIFCSHQFADCGSVLAFLSAWGMVCRGEPNFTRFNFNLADHFPARDLKREAKSISLHEQNVATKRFVFNEEILMALKREATSTMVMNPSKVEAVSAFIWKHVIETVESKTSHEAKRRLYIATHAVNLRKRTSPTHSLENVFGNCIMQTVAFYDINCVAVSVKSDDLAGKLRSSTKKINSNYIMKSQSGDSYLNDYYETSALIRQGEFTEWCIFTSWCKFPLYEIDHGWGNPVCVSTTAPPAKNHVVLMDTRCGKGIEAWVTMENHHLEMLHAKIKWISINVKSDG